MKVKTNIRAGRGGRPVGSNPGSGRPTGPSGGGHGGGGGHKEL
jgi:hypothetical protein